MRIFSSVLTAFAALLLAGCNGTIHDTRAAQVNNNDSPQVAELRTQEVLPVSGTAGQFLAAHYAVSESDFSRAADILYQLWQNDRESQIIGYGVVNNALVSGRHGMAIEVSSAMRELGIVPSVVGERNMLAIMSAIVDIKAERYTAAVREMQANTITSGPEQYIRPLVLAWAHLGKGEGLKAREVLRLQPEGNPIRNVLQLNLVYMAMYQQEYSLAVQELKELMKRLEQVPFGLQELYAKLLFVSDGEIAAQSYLRTIHGIPRRDTLMKELRETNAPSLDELRLARISDGLAEGINEMSKLLRNEVPYMGLLYANTSLYLNPSNHTALLIVGKSLFDLERYEESIFQLGKISDPSALSYSEAVTLAVDAEREMQQYQAAIDRLERAIKLLPDNVDFLSVLGQVYQQQEEYDKAIALYDQVIAGRLAQYPEWSDYYFRGIAYERSKRWPLAEKDLQYALGLEPNNAYVLNYLGYSWIDQRLNIPEALGLLERAVALEPNNAFIIDSYGWALYRVKRFAEAATSLERSLLFAPGESIINDHLGDVYWHLGRKREAKYQWERALWLEPDEPKQKRELEEKLAGTRMPKP